MQLGRMMVAALLAAGVVGTAGSAAQAQATDKPLSLRLGGFLPSDEDTQDALGTNFLSWGVGYDLKRFNSFLPGVVEAYFDFYKRPKNTADFGRVEALVLGLGLATRFEYQADGYKPYVGAGAGLYSSYFSQTLPPGTNGSATPLVDSARRVSLGGKFLIGAELDNGIFGEAEYNFVPHPSVFGSDISLSGFQLRLGYRFRPF
ncbi:MAG: hypothetical protein OHK0029_15370 [Armatimonadaceae bacterium]